MIPRESVRNRLLLALAADDFQRLALHARPVELESGKVLFEAGAQVDRIWFPETGLISLISVMLSGAMVETSVVGCEGGVGFIQATGGGMIFSRAVVQLPGLFICLPVSTYRTAFDASANLRRVVENHIVLLIAEARQGMACIALHKVEQRLAWWLLEAQDRIGGSAELPLTQEFLAVMLGVQRTTVTDAASGLQEFGLLRVVRGKVTILDAAALGQRSCECYAVTRSRINAALGAPIRHPPVNGQTPPPKA